MNLYEAEDFFKNLYKDKKITYEFDMNCLKQMEIVHTDGLPNEIGHVEYKKVKVIVEGMDPVYMPIAPHRGCIEFKEIKDYVSKCEKVYKTEEVKNG